MNAVTTPEFCGLLFAAVALAMFGVIAIFRP